jgi:pimeloyl-ACP methyl ester carboxylesterase
VRRARFDPLVLRDPAVGRIPAVRLGEGRVAVVLLHQTDGNGLCGWLPFMPALAEAGYAVLAIDLCSYGRSDCRAVTDGTFTDADQTDPVGLALRYARSTMRADRVAVVGASMGGSVALMSAATLPGVDVAVDLSGPVDWAGLDVVRRGRALRVPVLVAMATSEGPEQAAGAQEIVANAPAGSGLLTPDAGHGYALLNDVEGGLRPLSTDVLDWLREIEPPS